MGMAVFMKTAEEAQGDFKGEGRTAEPEGAQGRWAAQPLPLSSPSLPGRAGVWEDQTPALRHPSSLPCLRIP